jgi:hypothetical protein
MYILGFIYYGVVPMTQVDSSPRLAKEYIENTYKEYIGWCDFRVKLKESDYPYVLILDFGVSFM